MIDATGLTKRFGSKLAVDNLSFTVQSGIVTGFLGPNGAGKSTTMRLILGLDHPTSGQTRVNGRSYNSTKAPMTEVGALLEAKSVHPGRTARSHLLALAATHGIRKKRVDEVIELVGLGAVAKKRAGEFSLGMSQRLGLAAALLGDPETLMLDEPINGLDPEGVAWVRGLVRYLASQGRTIFISSHLMSEMALTADHLIIIGKGRLIADSPMAELIAQVSGVMTRVRSPQIAEIMEMTAFGWKITDDGDGSVTVAGVDAAAVGEEAARRGWVLHELTPVQRSLEDVYMELTDSAVEFQTSGTSDAMSHAIEIASTTAAPAAATIPEPVAAVRPEVAGATPAPEPVPEPPTDQVRQAAAAQVPQPVPQQVPPPVAAPEPTVAPAPLAAPPAPGSLGSLPPAPMPAPAAPIPGIPPAPSVVPPQAPAVPPAVVDYPAGPPPVAPPPDQSANPNNPHDSGKPRRAWTE